MGGTQTNVTVVIDTLLKSYEGVVAAKSGHVATHEAGAIEFGGHKVLELEAQQGKLSAETVKLLYIAGYYKDENYEHMVAPGMVYISRIPQNMERCIQKGNWKNWRTCVGNMRFRYIWMVQD